MADYARRDWINTTEDGYMPPEENKVNKTPLAAKMADTSKEEANEPPLPSEEDIETMLAEVRQLEQAELQEDTKQNRKNDPLKQVLSTIPSFSEINK